MGAGKPGLQRPRNDRRFPPPGVTPVPSYGWPPYKGGVAHGGGARGGASPQQPQRSTLRGQSPRRRGPGCARESALDTGWHGLPESSGVKRSAVPASRVHPVARRVVAPHRRGRKWRERPRLFGRWCGTGEGKGGQGSGHPLPPFFRGRSLHSDPWREGQRALPSSGPINRSVRPSTPAGQVAGPSPGSDRGSLGACGSEPGAGGLCSLGPVRALACPDGRLCTYLNGNQVSQQTFRVRTDVICGHLYSSNSGRQKSGKALTIYPGNILSLLGNDFPSAHVFNGISLTSCLLIPGGNSKQ